MPNIKSAEKRVKVAQKKTLENSIIKTGLKTQIKKLGEALNLGDKSKAEEQMNTTTKTIDKAVAKGVIHKNTANRKKSAMAKKLNSSK